MKLKCATRTIDLSTPKVMGIINATPDSFSDGGFNLNAEKAVESALQMVKDGADIIDIGGESSRPGADNVSVEEELNRVIPVIKILRSSSTIPISIDTVKPEVMKAAVEAGADIINDISALSAPGAINVVLQTGAAVCLMHMQGKPHTMQDNPVYSDVTGDVIHYLQQRVEFCMKSGIGANQIILDPGFGFGKTVEHNYHLFAKLESIVDLGYPVLVGVSRKSMIGNVLDKPVQQRGAGGLALAAIAVKMGAKIIRAHDVVHTADVCKVILELMKY
ncbi:MAG: dihydropteroate synthase [Gammaproteobacteria bacterium]|nr:MAG: dihydropteroate synthase [Gammaproteobacteria bacterium]